jgi:hypothetical protein
MPAGITYEVTNSNLPGWVPGSLSEQKLGLAYEESGYFVHFFGRDSGLCVVSSGLTATQAANGTLEDWVKNTFGATSIQNLDREVGHVVDGVWRPGLFWADQIFQSLRTDARERRAAEQTLHLLVESLNTLFLFIEPEGVGLETYGPKTRELLILACTEAEDGWTRFLHRAGRLSGTRFTTNDYVALAGPLHLDEFEVGLIPYANVPAICPYIGWDPSRPTQSLPWYDAYNKTKHDRTANLAQATLQRCIEAVAANVVLYCVRFSPYALFQQTTPLASLVTHLFSIDLVGPKRTSFYAPLIDPSRRRPDLVCGESRETTSAWTVDPLVV